MNPGLALGRRYGALAVMAGAVAVGLIVRIPGLGLGGGMVISNSFNGAGDTWTPTVLNLFCFWMLELPLAWVLARGVGIGPSGVFWAITVAVSSLAVASAVLFRRGRWKTRTL